MLEPAVTKASLRRILVVDDDLTSRRILVRALERLGHAVADADGGARALALLERVRPEIVVTDWEMPDLDGLELCRRIRAASPRTYVYTIMLTGRSQQGDVVAALDAGADEFLTKPVDATELQARLRTADRVLGLEAQLAARIRSLEEALELIRRNQERLVEAERLAAVGAVGITVRHEINNPLTGILGYADVYLSDREALPPGVAQAFEAVKKLAQRIAVTVARIERPVTTATTAYLGGNRMLDLGSPSGVA